MANNVNYSSNSKAAGWIQKETLVETEQQAGGEHRQVVKVGASALPSGAATSDNQTNGTQKTKIVGTDGSGLDVYTRTQTPTNKVIGVQIGPGDIISNIPVVIEYDHHQLHEGEMFRWSTYVASLNNNVSKDLRLVVPNIAITTNAVTQCPHFRLEVVSSLGGLAYLHEGTTFSADGTGRTPIAMERNGTYTPRLAIYEDPTINVLGTLIWQGLVLSNSRAGGTDSSVTEFILKNNTSYSVRFTSNAQSNQVLIRLVWYEDLGV